MKALVDLAVPAITVLVMLAVGLDLAPTDFARVRRQPRVVAAGLVGPLLVLPPLALLLVVVFAPSSDLQAGLLLIAACPIGGISTTYSYLAGASTALSISLTAISSLLAVVTIPLLGRVFGALMGQAIGLTAPLPLIRRAASAAAGAARVSRDVAALPPSGTGCSLAALPEGDWFWRSRRATRVDPCK